jgi:hypothetical protein
MVRVWIKLLPKLASVDGEGNIGRERPYVHLMPRKAAKVVVKSLPPLLKAGAVLRPSFDGKNFWVAAEVTCTLAELREALVANYGTIAADTWMEGDIMLGREDELHLKFQGVTTAKRHVPRSP